MAIEKVILARSRGFCAGVDMAIEAVELALEKYGSPVYVKHEVVHNKHVVESLKNKGAIFIEHPYDANPDLSRVMVFSAHGSPPEHYRAAREMNFKIIDASCPLVTKVHDEAKRFHEQGYEIVYIGHRNHVEALGVMGELEKGIHLVESAEDVQKLDIGNPSKLVYLTQTTLSLHDTAQTVKALKQRYPQMLDTPKEDICYATTNRQEAVKELAKLVNIILVVGSRQSSNANRLVETAKQEMVNGYLIDSASEILPDWFSKYPERVGLASAASTPEYLVKEVLERPLFKDAEVVELREELERVKFRLPEGLRELKTTHGLKISELP